MIILRFMLSHENLYHYHTPSIHQDRHLHNEEPQHIVFQKKSPKPKVNVSVFVISSKSLTLNCYRWLMFYLQTQLSPAIRREMLFMYGGRTFIYSNPLYRNDTPKLVHRSTIRRLPSGQADKYILLMILCSNVHPDKSQYFLSLSPVLRQEYTL